MKSALTLLVCLLGFWSSTSRAEYEVVPVVRLLCHGESFTGKSVSAAGVLGFKDGYLGLYQDLESQKRGITTNAVQVGLAESYDVDVRKLRKLVGKHVMVQGGYHRESGLQFASGTIEAVRIYSLPVKLVE